MRVDSDTVGRFELTLGAGPPHNSEDGGAWHEKTAFYPDALGNGEAALATSSRFSWATMSLACRAPRDGLTLVQRRVRTFSATISALKENTWASIGSTVTLIQ